jgi:hypothetical protein
MTLEEIAKRLAGAVLDRIEADRLLNRDNVTDALVRELASMRATFAADAQAQQVRTMLEQHWSKEQAAALAKSALDFYGYPERQSSAPDAKPGKIKVTKIPGLTAIAKGGPIDGHLLPDRGLTHWHPLLNGKWAKYSAVLNADGSTHYGWAGTFDKITT